MKKPTIKQKITAYLKSSAGFVPKWELEQKAKDFGALAESVNRRCRELEADGIIEVKQVKGVDYYAYKGVEKVVTYYEILDDENGRRAVKKSKVVYA